ncbi:beta-N-acetylhexosaminidase [Streptomyces sp. RerS4]|uniref:beta-N-acetylhexosaminidase n=1 Tax=Streptomyces sp. RerS4 TaxID=2942449 RepID=UPI00201BC190|nr:beta-N-acetylhexosaminidase [Streptomyces sp. RerS4]UQX04206.1 beta-N-acetylhexosaminidase [Streptomyces sp. RerS4]
MTQHRTAPPARRLPRLLGSLLLLAAAVVSTAAAPAPAPAAPVPLGRVVPVPASVAPGGSAYQLTSSTVIRVDSGSAESRAVGEYLAGVLRPSTGYRLPVVAGAGGDGIQLRLGAAADPALGDEGYRLVSGSRTVRVSANAPAGLFHAVQTLRQLLPASVEKRSVQPGPWRIAGGTVTDSPRYAYRGVMVDVSRHFFTVEQIKRYIDQAALYKVNTLHLHLSDDQGWRIAIDSWPRLATYGGSTQVGGGPGGHYDKADYQAIVAHAASRFMEVVPEIDTPGHTNAALASYAELNCDGVARPLYTGTEVGFSSLCVAKPVTYTFLDDVLRELAALTPGRYVHIGGDEAAATPAADYATFMDKVQPLVGRYGKTVMAWHQIAEARPAPGAIAQYWGLGGTEPEVAAAARAGTRLVMSPANHAYLDMKYTRQTPLGLEWAGLVEVDKSYAWDPDTLVAGVPAGAVLGVEAPLWTETLSTSAHLEYMAFPRLLGIAEIGWSPAATHDWSSYRQRLAAQGPRLDALGITYYRSPKVPWTA